MQYPVTPDGRYFVVKGRLWRATNPGLDGGTRQQLTNELMSARRSVQTAKGNPEALQEARARIDRAKVALGERGPVWWNDGSRDYNRYLAKSTPYADWWASVERAD